MKKRFYNSLYYIAMKKRLIDNVEVFDLNDNYFVKIKFEDIYFTNNHKTIIVEIYDKRNPNSIIYEIKFQKYHNSFGLNDDYSNSMELLLDMTIFQKKDFILSKDRYRYLNQPYHSYNFQGVRKIDKTLYYSILKLGKKVIQDINRNEISDSNPEKTELKIEDPFLKVIMPIYEKIRLISPMYQKVFYKDINDIIFDYQRMIELGTWIKGSPNKDLIKRIAMLETRINEAAELYQLTKKIDEEFRNIQEANKLISNIKN